MNSKGFANVGTASAATWLQRPANVGIVYILLTAGCFATTDATVKHLGATLPVLVLLWARYMFQTTAMATWQGYRRGRAMFRSGHLRLQALRAMLLLANATCSFVGLQHLPLPEFTALAMLAPMASTLLAALVLREKVTPGRWAMVVLGFIGMLVIVRPGGSEIGWAAAFPICGALLFAAFQIVTNRLSAVDDMVTTNFYSGLGATLLLCVALIALPIDAAASLRQASSFEWILIGLLGLIATIGQMSMVMAIRSAPLSTLTPFGYVQIAFAAVIGWMLYRHAPDAWSAAGMLLIAMSGVATVWLNARERLAEPAASR